MKKSSYRESSSEHNVCVHLTVKPMEIYAREQSFVKSKIWKIFQTSSFPFFKSFRKSRARGVTNRRYKFF